MTLNQLLVEMDGFEENEGIIVIGATNYPQSLDKALVRPGRFDRHIAVPLLDVKGRKEILDLYLSKVKCYEGRTNHKNTSSKKKRKNDKKINGGEAGEERKGVEEIDEQIPDSKVLARGTPGVSGADLANIVNSAALKASTEGSDGVRMSDLEWAKVMFNSNSSIMLASSTL